MVTGWVSDLLSGVSVSITVIAPNNNLVAVQNTSVGADKKFSAELIGGGLPMQSEGTYTIAVMYGNQSRYAETTFWFVPISDELGSGFAQLLEMIRDLTVQIQGLIQRMDALERAGTGIQCPVGQVSVDGICMDVICPVGYELDGNYCIEIHCDVGYELNYSTNMCEFAGCPSNYVLQGNKCVNDTAAPIHPDAQQGSITRIVDGDTVHIDGTSYRLNLIDTPERGENGFQEATDALEGLCPVNSQIYYDDDSITPMDRYGRHLGVIWCQGNNYATTAGEYLFDNGHVKRFYTDFCSTTEAATEEWAIATGNWFYYEVCN